MKQSIASNSQTQQKADMALMCLHLLNTQFRGKKKASIINFVF